MVYIPNNLSAGETREIGMCGTNCIYPEIGFWRYHHHSSALGVDALAEVVWIEQPGYKGIFSANGCTVIGFKLTH